MLSDESVSRISFKIYTSGEFAGELHVITEAQCWFDYYYWLDDNKAPDFTHTIDIHRKPGYDPVELFIDTSILLIKLNMIKRLLQK